MNMEKKLIKILEVLGDYVKEHNNCTIFEIDFDQVGNLMNPRDAVHCLNGSKISTVNTPIPFSRDIEIFFDDLLSSEVGTESPDDSEYSYYEMIVDTVSRKITIYGIYYELVVDESFSEEIDLEGEYKELFWNDLYSKIGDNLRTFDVLIIGGGDSGYIECELHSLPNDVEEILLGILEDRAPGWEMNDGSSGKFVINPIEKTIQFNFGFYEEEHRMEEEYMYIY